MVEFDLLAALVGGLVATGVMTAMMQMATRAGMHKMHPRMSLQPVGAGTPDDGRTVAVDQRGEVEIAAPGMLGTSWGGMTPVGFLMGHAVYGLVLALVYGAIA